LRRKILGSVSRSRVQLHSGHVDAEVELGGSARTDRNDGESAKKEKKRRGRVVKQLTYRSVVDSSSTSSEDEEDEMAAEEFGEDESALFGDGGRPCDRHRGGDVSAVAGYSTLEVTD
jgi:hypothetical protein